jgi:hypothetical protein
MGYKTLPITPDIDNIAYGDTTHILLLYTMQNKIIYILILLFSSTSFGQEIKTITEFTKENDSLIKLRMTEFNKAGDITKEINFGGYDPISETFRNNKRTIEYKDGIRISELNCEDFVSKDTCVVRSFSTYKFNPKTGIEKQTKFEADSLIRFIREIEKKEKITISKTNTWEFFPVKEPNYENALTLIDTAFFDKKNRMIKRVVYNSRMEKPIIQKYNYSENKYSYQIIGTPRDTILTYDYIELQKKIDEINIEYKFNTADNYKYEIEYY